VLGGTGRDNLLESKEIRPDARTGTSLDAEKTRGEKRDGEEKQKCPRPPRLKGGKASEVLGKRLYWRDTANEGITAIRDFSSLGVGTQGEKNRHDFEIGVPTTRKRCRGPTNVQAQNHQRMSGSGMRNRDSVTGGRHEIPSERGLTAGSWKGRNVSQTVGRGGKRVARLSTAETEGPSKRRCEWKGVPGGGDGV